MLYLYFFFVFCGKINGADWSHLRPDLVLVQNLFRGSLLPELLEVVVERAEERGVPLEPVGVGLRVVPLWHRDDAAVGVGGVGLHGEVVVVERVLGLVEDEVGQGGGAGVGGDVRLDAGRPGGLILGWETT